MAENSINWCDCAYICKWQGKWSMLPRFWTAFLWFLGVFIVRMFLSRFGAFPRVLALVTPPVRRFRSGSGTAHYDELYCSFRRLARETETLLETWQVTTLKNNRTPREHKNKEQSTSNAHTAPLTYTVVSAAIFELLFKMARGSKHIPTSRIFCIEILKVITRFIDKNYCNSISYVLLPLWKQIVSILINFTQSFYISSIGVQISTQCIIRLDLTNHDYIGIPNEIFQSTGNITPIYSTLFQLISV